ncbi:MAG: fatty acid desaturase [Burkholderiaceae bacterium]
MPWPLILSSVFVGLPALGLLLGMPWLGLAVGAVVVPLAEWVWGTRAAGRPIRSAWLLRLLMGAVICQILGLSVYAAALDTDQWIFLALSMGYVAGGAGIVLAHELGHRRVGLDQWLSRILLASVAWGPYRVEHNRGHHRHAATFDDPASARASESFYRFLPRYLRGVYVNGWRLSSHPAARWHEAAALVGLSLVLALTLWLAGGLPALGFWLVQAATAIFLVAAVDYVEHWGLVRRQTERGVERMGPSHTWDCGNGLAEALLFNLPRHAHHHLAPGEEGHALQRIPEAPQMPTGYAGMVLLAAIPWAWFRVMRPRLERVQSVSSA